MKQIKILSLLLCFFLLTGCTAAPEKASTQVIIIDPALIQPLDASAAPTPVPTAQTAAPTAAPTPAVPSEPEPLITPEPTPSEQIFLISLAGDCTLATEQGSYGSPGSFVALVGDDYAYPFAAVLPFFEQDDFTFVNFEGTLTDSTAAAEKLFRFRAPREYAQILVEGGIDGVTLANNHTMDFGQRGYEDTKTSLEAAGIPYVEHGKTMLYETENGLKIGVYAVFSDIAREEMISGIRSLYEQGAQLTIMAMHTGTEGSYSPTDKQRRLAHWAIDAGANIVMGHHSHVLQPMEQYQNGLIFYSLGNFSFGGNRNPSDKDTVIVQQEIILSTDGAVTLGQTHLIPCCLSGHRDHNDYQPTPYTQDDPAYDRVLTKLDGTFTGSDLVVTRTEVPYGATRSPG